MDLNINDYYDEEIENISATDNDLLNNDTLIENISVEDNLLDDILLESIIQEDLKESIIEDIIPVQKEEIKKAPMTIEEKINKIKTAESDNETLVISERTNSIYLPYKISELLRYIETYPNVYASLAEVVDQEFILPFDYFMNHPFKSRFFETYNLIRNRQGKPATHAVRAGLKLIYKHNKYILFKYFASIYKILSPSKIFPSLSTAIILSASPSNANPQSNPFSTTNFCKCSICVDPHSVLIFKPFGSLLMTYVFAPKAS